MAEKKKGTTRKIPVLSVLKKGIIFKHIILNSNQETNQEEQEDDPILVGRHPDCHIVLDHPSISRFHLQLRVADPISQKLSVTDLNSVHGTWVCGSRIDPGVAVELGDGDVMKIGGSTRVYRLQWVPEEMAWPLPALAEEKEDTHQDGENERVDDEFISENLVENGSCEEEGIASDSEKLTPKTISSVEDYVDNEKEDGVEVALHESLMADSFRTSAQEEEEEEEEEEEGANQDEEDRRVEVECLRSDELISENLGELGEVEKNYVDNEEDATVEKYEAQTIASDKEYFTPEAILVKRNCVTNEKEEGISDSGMNFDEGVVVVVVESLVADSLATSSEKEETHQEDENKRVEVDIHEGLRTVELISENPAELGDDKEVQLLETVIGDNESSTIVEQTGSYEEEEIASDEENLTPKTNSVIENCVENENEEGVSSSEMSFDKEVEVAIHENLMADTFATLPEEKEETHQNEENERPEVLVHICLRSVEQNFENLGEIEDYEEEKPVEKIRDNEDNTLVEKNGSSHEERFALGKEILTPKTDNLVVNEKAEGVSSSVMNFDRRVALEVPIGLISVELASENIGEVEDDEEVQTVEKNGDNKENTLVHKNGSCQEAAVSLDEKNQTLERDNCVNSEKAEGMSGSVMNFKRIKVATNDNLIQEISSVADVDLKLDDPISENLSKSGNNAELEVEETITENYVSSEKEEKVSVLEMENAVSEVVEDLNLDQPNTEYHVNCQKAEETPKETLELEFSSVLNELPSDGMSEISISSKGEETLVQDEIVPLEVYSDQKLEKSHQVQLSSSSNVITSSDAKEVMICPEKEKSTPARALANHECIVKECVNNERKEEETASHKENMTPNSLRGLKSKKLPSKIMKKMDERMPFQNLRNSNSVNFCPRIVHKGNSTSVNLKPPNRSPLIRSQKSLDKQKITWKGEHMKWNIVVDSSSFLDEESAKSLQLLEGLRGTHLIIPRIVIRELDCLRKREYWFRRGKKVFNALKWIEDCMKSGSWIHVQSSAESKSSMPFSACGSFMEIASSTVADHILDTALMFRRIQTDGELILLTDNISLKIKAMAEGLLCETPKEFRDSLVNPCSKRFLWGESSPRGSTWSLSDQIGIRENMNCCEQWLNSKKTEKVYEGVKGLKVVLLHGFQ